MKASFLKRDGFAYYVNRFLGSRLYLFLVSLLIFLAHTFAAEVPVALVLFFFLMLGFFFAEDLRFLIPILTGGICIVSLKHTPYLPTQSDFYTTGYVVYLIAVGIVLLCVGLAVFLWRRRRFAASFSSLRLRWGFLAFFAAMVFSGLFEQENVLKNLGYSVGVGASFFAVYLLFGLFHPKTRQNAEHFMFAILCVGLLVSAELGVLFLRSVTFEGGLPVKGSIVIGWGAWTHIGAMLAMCLPAPFCLAREAGRTYPLYLLAGAVITAALFFSASRAAWLYGGIILLLSVLLLCLGGKNRKRSRILVFAVFLCGVATVIAFFPKIMDFLLTFVQFGAGDNGRYAIWEKAFEAFLAAPIFGRGFYNTGIVLSFPPIMPFLCHNTPLQMLGSTGALGLALYLYHRFETVRLLFCRRGSALSLFLLLVPIALVLVSITDEHIFHIYPAFFYAIALSLAEGRYEESPLIEK